MKFKWNPLTIYNEVCDYLENLDDTKEVVVYISSKETKEMRTKYQNDMFYWLFWEVGNHLWETAENVKIYFLAWCFWTKTVKLSKITQEIPIIMHTSDLKKDQAIFFIDTILTFIKLNDIPCKYTPRDIQSLYDSYKWAEEHPMSTLDENFYK